MRAVLIVNPNATSTTAATRDLLAHALESRVKLTVAHTDHRGHAIDIARDAARDGIDVLIIHGGDGTVNEVVNGVLGECGRVPHADAPAVGVVPGRIGQRVRQGAGHQPRPDRSDQPTRRPARRAPPNQVLAAHRADGLRRTLGGIHRRHGRGRRRRGGRGSPAGQGPQGHRRQVHPRRRARDAGQCPQGAVVDAAPARPGRGVGRALRVRVELQPMDLRQHPAGVDEPGPRPSRTGWAFSPSPA